jgi:superfamily II DNA or RNA helicase
MGFPMQVDSRRHSQRCSCPGGRLGEGVLRGFPCCSCDERATREESVELRSRLLSVGVKVDFWERDALKKFAADVIPEYPPSRIAPRVYQREAIECARRGLESEDRALVILATGLGKTAVAGELIHDHLSRQQAGAVLLLAHTKDLVRQLDRAMWRHLPKSVKTGVVTGDERRPTLEGVTAATVESGLT